MRVREFTTEERSSIVTDYQAGETVQRLRIRYDTGWTQISRVLREHGVYEGRQRSHRAKLELEVCDHYRAGKSLATVARIYGKTNGWVLKILRKHDVQTRPTGSPVPGYVPRIRELREAGLGARKIAKDLNISVTTVQKWLRKWGMASPLPKGHSEGAGHPAWGGGSGVVSGYRYVWVPKDDPYRVMAWKSRGSVPEHRLVMARSLGRPLDRRETVHHINGDTLDNRIENLQLRKGQHGKGIAVACLDCGSHNVGAVPLP